MDLPTKAEDAHANLAAAFNTKNLDTVLKMYDTNGIIFPEPNKKIADKEGWKEAIQNIMDIPGTMEIKTVYCLQFDDIALGRSEWCITNEGKIKVAAKGIEVMKRQEDGTWKIVIDHAFGAEADLTA
ncbi:YybH family protein [Sinomicrobium weinanense]|uniref:DUF4440 domain-containing protein n=1 Tax=Sinomicrobium weinanense TaxID=2842200 RepID=A0A926Q1K3_9FLAO|nr:DUF4440 domain-containing protein [Sinomicrobium weinanense]MBC9795713.1 DUF4440 domain-containing protein [Sinomicrobium weinanense]MBU3125276.1 DUF4440 domain-containing protein [Sinomicrobium weinanense]